MTALDTTTTTASPFQLCFRSMYQTGRGFAFPCDARGRVELDALSEKALNNYLFARGVVGREFLTPAVERCFHA